MNKKIEAGSCDLKDRTKKNTLHLGYWTVAWVLATAWVAFGSKHFWDFDALPTFFGVLIQLFVGIGMICANKRYLHGIDELQRHIQHGAMGLTLGVGLVAGVSYEMLEDIKLITFEPEISHLMILMSLTYCVGLILGNRQYR